MGRWDGLTAAEITARESGALEAWQAGIADVPFPGGESAGDLLSRAWPAFTALVARHAGGRIAVVAHGGTNRVLLCRALGLPLARLLVEGGMEWSWMLLGFSSLSFLGFGISPPNADWGLMVADGRLYLQLAPWTVLPPIVMLASLIIGINLTADALGKALGIDRARKVLT